MTTNAAPATTGRDPADYDDDALDRLADLLAERLAVRLSGLMPTRAEPLVDAGEIARLHGKTRSWVYEHAGELGAARLGSGPRPRLAFSPARVAEQLEKVDKPATAPLPEAPQRGAGASVPVAPRQAHRCCMCDPSKPRSPLSGGSRGAVQRQTSSIDPLGCRRHSTERAPSRARPEAVRVL